MRRGGRITSPRLTAGKELHALKDGLDCLNRNIGKYASGPNKFDYLLSEGSAFKLYPDLFSTLTQAFFKRPEA